MKYLLWDERRAGVLACQRFAPCFAEVTRNARGEACVPNKAMENT